jgi:hypothetical protein
LQNSLQAVSHLLYDRFNGNRNNVADYNRVLKKGANMSTELKDFSTLFNETWALFKTRALTILGVLFLTSLLVLAGMALLAGGIAALIPGGAQAAFEQLQQGQFNGTVVSALGVFFLVVMVLAMWSQSATLAVVVDDTMGVREALRVGWQRLWSMTWILALAGSIIMVGFMLFMVPGIIFTVSLMFALYPLYDDEELRGMDAVMASRRYVKGRWWNSFGKLLLIWLIAIVFDLIPLVGPFLYFLFTPFLLLFLVAMYRDLKATAAEISPDEHRGGWWLLALTGLLLPLVGIVIACISAGPQFLASLQLTQQQEELQIGVVPPLDQDRVDDRIPISSGVGQGVWRDPVGDVSAFGVGRWMDIETVSVKADEGLLLIEVQTQLPLAAAFNAASTTAQSFYRLATLYFDTDVNRQTGGHPGDETGRTGYDLGLDITLEAPRNEPENGQVYVSLFRFENGLRKFFGPLPEGQVLVQGDLIRVRLPYEVLGVGPGDQVRMSFQEAFQEQGSGLSKDKIIDL